MLVRAQGFLVLEDGFSGVAVVDACQQAARPSAAVVISLSPQMAAMCAMLTVGMPQAFNICVAYSPRTYEMLRSNTTSKPL